MADGQFNVIPTLKNLPLNLIEFQNSIVNKEKFELIDQNGKVNKSRLKQYKEFIPPYLYYFDTRFDNRYGDIKDKLQVDGKNYLMLVPKGANNPTIFQVNGKIDCYYTNSIADFYPEL
jgi:hypothetical protein